MPEARCRQCRKTISPTGLYCPHCGSMDPHAAPKTKKEWGHGPVAWGFLIVVLVLVGLAALGSGSNLDDPAKRACDLAASQPDVLTSRSEAVAQAQQSKTGTLAAVASAEGEDPNDPALEQRFVNVVVWCADNT